MFRVTATSPSEFLLSGTWTACLRENEGDVFDKSPLFGFKDVGFRFSISQEVSELQVIIDLVSGPSKPFSMELSLLIGSMAKSCHVTFRPETNCAFINFGVERSEFVTLLEAGMIDVKFRMDLVFGAQKPKKRCEWTGLSNQGATCYLNSLLQTLFHIPLFRSRVFQIPVGDSTGRSASIVYNLRKLFIGMQMNGSACSTKALTTSFGWTAADAFTQRDVQELCREFLDKLEHTLLGTQMEDAISSLFKGSVQHRVDLTSMEGGSCHYEDFYDMSIDVAGCKSLADSFGKFTACETLTGDNKYDAGEHGKQDAVMQTKLMKLPMILHLHLRRFTFDGNMNLQVKLNNRFEFPECLDLSEFVTEEQNAVYELFGIIVHAGSAQSGHYFAFVRPTKSPQWYVFNDELVERVDTQKVMNVSFGRSRSDESAYMLVYVRQSDIDSVFSVSSTVQGHIQTTDDDDDDEKTRMSLITECDLRRECGELDLKGVGSSGWIQMIQSMTGAELIATAAEILGMPSGNTHLWCVSGTGLERIKRDGSSTHSHFMQSDVVFARISNDCISSDEVMVFVKYFTPDLGIRFLTSHVAKRSSTVSSVLSVARELLGFPYSTPMRLFKKKYLSLELLGETGTFESEHMCDGAILVCQLDKNVSIIDPVFPFGAVTPRPTVMASDGLTMVSVDTPLNMEDAADYVSANYDTGSAVVSAIENPSDKLFVIRFARLSGISDIKRAVAEQMNLGYDPERNVILLYTGSGSGDSDRIGNMISSVSVSHKRIFFRFVEDVAETSMSEMLPIKCRLGKGSVRVELVRKDSTLSDLVNKLGRDPSVSMLVSYGAGFEPAILAMSTSPAKVFGVLSICDKPESSDPNEKLCAVCPISQSDLFAPFFFGIRESELFSDTKGRLVPEFGMEGTKPTNFLFRFQTRDETGVMLPDSRVILSDTACLFEKMVGNSCIVVSEIHPYNRGSNLPIIKSSGAK